MDEYTGKRAVDRNPVSRKEMSRLLRNAANTKDQSVKLCSRPNCSSKIHSSIVAENASCRKGKSLRPSTLSSLSGKEAVGRSCRTFSGTSNPRRSLKEPQQILSSRLETGSSETSGIQDEPEVEQGHGESDNVMLMEAASTSGVSKTRSWRNFHQPGLRGQETKSIGSVTRAGSSRYTLRNVKCNSINDVRSSTYCSSSDSTTNRRTDMVRRNCERETGYCARGKKLSGSSLEGHNSGSGRRSRNIHPHRDNIATVRTRRSTSGNAGERFPSRVNACPLQPNESPALRPPLPHERVFPHHACVNAYPLQPNESPALRPPLPHERVFPHHACVNAYTLQPNESPALRPPLPHERVFPHHACAESPLIRLSSRTSRPGSSNRQPASPAESDITCPLINQTRQQYQNSTAEVLLALSRIDQDEELTEEEIHLLETNDLPNGPYLYDQHRDMRMDIDDMSYEELLALEERMGTVSTALTEGALSECLKRSIYRSSPSDDDDDERSNIINDDIICCICLEEYVVGDEVGSLQCEHGYHFACIQQWLRLKYWCPICKASAAPSDSSAASNQA